MWLDNQGRLRRVRASVALSLPGAEWTGTTDTVNGQITATPGLFDFGTDVTVAVPPSAEADDLTSLVSTRGLEAVGDVIGLI